MATRCSIGSRGRPPPRATAPDSTHERVVRALREPGFFGAGPVEVRETHISWVFLVGDRAFKLKKALALAFVDYGTPERRRLMCEEEVRLNRRLAPRVYLGVRSVVARDGGFELGAADRDDAAEHVVEMRRFDESATLAAQLRAGVVDRDALDASARSIAAFHRGQRPAPVYDGAARLRAVLGDSLDALDDLVTAPQRSDVAALRRFIAAYLGGPGQLLDERGRLAVDGHGDLRAEHVVLERPVQIVDCVEFDAALRVRDPASDLAFLTMDVESLGHPEVAECLVDGYRRAGGDPGTDDLLAFYAVERALVRAKVDAIRAGQLGAESVAGRKVAERGACKLALARRLAWRARGPLALVVCGLSGSGKTSLATAVGDRLGARVLSSDVVRKQLAGVPATEPAPSRAYTAAFSRSVYAELGRRARYALSQRAVPIVIDATARDAGDRRELIAALGQRPLFVRCVAPLAVLAERVRRRAELGASASDADEPVLATQRFAPLAEVAPDAVCELRTDRPLDAIAGDLERWLDERLAAH